MEYVLWEISFTNLNMLSAAIQGYDPIDEDDDAENSPVAIEFEDIRGLGEYLNLPKL